MQSKMQDAKRRRRSDASHSVARFVGAVLQLTYPVQYGRADVSGTRFFSSLSVSPAAGFLQSGDVTAESQNTRGH